MGLQVYGKSTNALSGYNIHTNNLIVADGAPGATRGFDWAEAGVAKWSSILYPNEAGEFWYLFNHDSEEIPLTISTGARIAINKQANIMNYHTLWMNPTGDVTADNIVIGGTYARPQQRKYSVEIDVTGTPDTWKYRSSLDNGVTWTAYLGTNNCTTVPTNMENGITVAFTNSTGHTTNDSWQFNAFSELPQGTLTVIPTMFTEVLTTTNNQNATPTFRDVTYNTSSTEGNPIPVLATTNSATYVGKKARFNSTFVTVVVPAEGANLVSEYWNGSGWQQLNASNYYSDGTLNLTVSGKRYWDKTTMTNWAKTILPGELEGYNLYWIRYRTTSTPTTVASIGEMAPQTEKRFSVYSQHLDGTPTFYVDTIGGTYGKNIYRTSTNTTYAPTEMITQARLLDAIASLKPQVWFLSSNNHSVVTSQRSMALGAGTPWILTNVLASGVNTCGTFVVTNQIGTTNLAAGLAWTLNLYASKSSAGNGINLSAQLLEIGLGVTNVLRTTPLETVMPGVTTVGVFPLTFTLSANTNVASTNYLAARVLGNRTAGAVNLLVYGGTTYPSEFDFPITSVTNVEADPIALPRVVALESPFQSFSSTNYAALGTCTITYASGALVQITATNSPTTLAFDNANFPTNGVSRVSVELWAGTNAIAFATASITNAVAPTISTNSWNSLFYRRSDNNAAWNGRQ